MKNKVIKNVAITCACLLLCLAVVLGCIFGLGGKGKGQNKSLTLNKTELTLMEGQFEYLTASTTVTWTSDSENVEVDQNGRVMAIAETETSVTITAKAGNKTAICTVTVTPNEIKYSDLVSVDFEVDNLPSEYFEHEHAEKDCTNTYSFNETTKLDENGVIYITSNPANRYGQKTPNLSEKDSSTNATYKYSIKTQGRGSADNGSLKFVLEKAAQIEIRCRNSSSNIDNMQVGFFDYKYSQIGESKNISKKSSATLTFETVQGGDFYIGTLGGSLDVYEILIYYAE